MKELTKSEEQMMDIFWDSKEALTSVDIVKMQVKATWTNGLVHNIIRSLVQNGYLKECGMEQFGRQYARKLMPALTREEYIAKLMIQKSEGKSSVKQMVVALAKESEDMEQVIEELGGDHSKAEGRTVMQVERTYKLFENYIKLIQLSKNKCLNI